MKFQSSVPPAIWFPTIRTGTGTDIFTLRLKNALIHRGIQADISWLPHRAQFIPWILSVPTPPDWANIVHINSWLPRPFIPNDLPVVVTHHSSVHDPSLTPYKDAIRAFYHQKWIKPWEAYNAQHASVVTAVSRYTAGQVAQAFSCGDIKVIYNGIDTNAYSPIRRNRPHHPFRLLYIGKLGRLKGSDLLPKIMRSLGPDFELRYTGSPEYFGSIIIPTNMTHIGRLEGDAALIAAYRDADALLFPSRLEGLSLVALEAQACGLPILATDVASLPEVVIHKKTGILCSMDDVDAFVAAARYLRDQPARWRQMSEQSRNRALLFFGEEIALQQWISTYDRCLSSAQLKNIYNRS